jgi:hypothetical protein
VICDVTPTGSRHFHVNTDVRHMSSNDSSFLQNYVELTSYTNTCTISKFTDTYSRNGVVTSDTTSTHNHTPASCHTRLPTLPSISPLEHSHQAASTGLADLENHSTSQKLPRCLVGLAIGPVLQNTKRRRHRTTFFLVARILHTARHAGV